MPWLAFMNMHGLHEGGDTLETYGGSLMLDARQGSNPALERELHLTKSGAIDKSNRFLTMVLTSDRVNSKPGLKEHLLFLRGLDPAGKNYYAERMEWFNQSRSLMELVVEEANRNGHLLQPYKNEQGAL